MPLYEYQCKDCLTQFEVWATMAQYSQGLRAQCPFCNSVNAERKLSAPNVATGKKENKSGGSGCGPGCCCGG